MKFNKEYPIITKYRSCRESTNKNEKIGIIDVRDNVAIFSFTSDLAIAEKTRI